MVITRTRPLWYTADPYPKKPCHHTNLPEMTLIMRRSVIFAARKPWPWPLPYLGPHRKSTWNTGSDWTGWFPLRLPLPFFQIALIVFRGRGEAHAIAGPSLHTEFLAGILRRQSNIWRPRPVPASGFVACSGLRFGTALIPKESDGFVLFTLIFAHDGGPISKQG